MFRTIQKTNERLLNCYSTKQFQIGGSVAIAAFVLAGAALSFVSSEEIVVPLAYTLICFVFFFFALNTPPVLALLLLFSYAALTFIATIFAALIFTAADIATSFGIAYALISFMFTVLAVYFWCKYIKKQKAENP